MIRFRLWAMTIQVEFLFVALITVFLLLDHTGLAIYSLFACFLHEAGHLLAFLLVGNRPKAMIMELTGIRIVKSETALRPKEELFVQAAGIIANLTASGLTALFARGMTAQLFAMMNLVLACWHLLPVRILDGGKLFGMLLCLFLPLDKAEIVMTAAEICTALAIFALLIVGWFFGYYQLTLILAEITILFGSFSNRKGSNLKRRGAKERN